MFDVKAQDNDDFFCHEVSEKKAVSLYKKGIDKKTTPFSFIYRHSDECDSINKYILN